MKMGRGRLLAISMSVTVLVILVVFGSYHSTSLAQAESVNLSSAPLGNPILLQATGYITMLRVHDVGTGYGGSTDFLDGEVVIRLDSQEGKAFGFQLRNDDNTPVREGMLGLLRDAFNNDWIVTINYWIEPGNTNGQIIRVWLTKPAIL
jgi:hypothetical protein